MNYLFIALAMLLGIGIGMTIMLGLCYSRWPDVESNDE